MILPNQRKKFDIPEDICYLDCAYMSPLPRKTLAAGKAGLYKKARPWQIGTEDFFDLGESLRQQMAMLVDADASDFALIPSVSYGMSVIANNLQLEAGSEILLLDRQFPSNVYPWSSLAARCGARSVTLARKPGQNWTDAVLSAISPRTSLIALPHVHWIDGGLLDLPAIRQSASTNGAALVLDVTQSLGAVPFSVKDIAPDFFVVANYKWMLGPYTTGFLYAAKHQQSGTPLEQCWQSRKGSENFSDLTAYTDQLSHGATRYDMGERSNFAALPAVQASLQQIQDWGVANIAETIRQKTTQIAQIAQSHGLTVANCGPSAPHYLSVHLPPDAPNDLLDRARSKGVYFSHRGDRLRITPHLWVNDDDLARFDQAMADLF